MDKLKAGDTVEYSIVSRGIFTLDADTIENMEMIINDHLYDTDQDDEPPTWSRLLEQEICDRQGNSDDFLAEAACQDIWLNGVLL